MERKIIEYVICRLIKILLYRCNVQQIEVIFGFLFTFFTHKL